MKLRILYFLIVACIFGSVYARVMRSWTYDEMLGKSEVVVIATFDRTKDTDERTELRDVTPPVKVVGITTEFETLVVFKGSKDLKKFRLHHYRFQDPNEMNFVDAPHLIRLPTPSQDGERHVGHDRFLMFLVKEADGRFAPVSGQTDPGAFSIHDLSCGD